MPADDRLARRFLAGHPEPAARLLETMNPDEVAAVIGKLPPRSAALVLGRMLPTDAARCAARLAVRDAAAIAEHLPNLPCAALLRHLDAAAREAVLEQLGAARSAPLRLLLHYPPNTVGAWMQPSVLTFFVDNSAREAAQQIRHAQDAQPLIYVLDRDRRAVGAVDSLRLLSGTRNGPILALAEPVEPIWARESVLAAQQREVWERHSLAPVVNRQDEFVGVLAHADMLRACRQSLRPARGHFRDESLGDFAELMVAGLDSAWQGFSEIIRPADAAAPKDDS